MAYELGIEIFGAGLDPENRSHWAIVIYKPEQKPLAGDLLHVRLIDIPKLWFQFEYRKGLALGTELVAMQIAGISKIGNLSEQQRQAALKVITSEKAPRDGRKDCQDWVFDALLSLESEELVPSGTCHFWQGMVGKPANVVQEASGAQWRSLK